MLFGLQLASQLSLFPDCLQCDTYITYVAVVFTLDARALAPGHQHKIVSTFSHWILFSVFPPRLFSDLINGIKQCSNVNSFKSRLKKVSFYKGAFSD